LGSRRDGDHPSGDRGVRMTKPLPASLALPDTPATLRARISMRVELARDLDPESLGYLLAHQRIADLERQLAAMEGRR